ncbi:MAG: DNA primase [Candidatus Pacebacteria bacterium]|nr:DNA primase [Candidatus Paceibacterota bacterium]MDD2757149.1 DNA primase [Candidatus Paceibacterota bacterium]MDD3969697.1 DNA primase [Candidatus Paceibacterota bacterium]
MNSEIEQIKSRLNIVDIIGEYIKLEKAGINYRAPCPFHNEKTPSFFVSPSRQMWHCFGGCNEGGDIFKFVMKIEGVEFIDALKLLAKKAGVQLKESSKKYEEIKTQREILLSICKKATAFFSTQLEKSKSGLEAKDYLLKRGFKEETIKDWKIGYAPSTWNSLCDYLIGLGYKREDIINAGMASEKFFDRFRSRIIFPICDASGQSIGFTGRVFNSEDEAKYLNTPNTLLYDKSQALYGIDKAKIEIRKKDSCILVEGNVDCIMSHQSGVKNCLAVSGTALTTIHLGIIKRFSNNLTFAFDMDLAGNNATKKGIDMAINNGFNVKVIAMNNEKDPADIILSSGEEEWKRIIEGAKPINQFYFDLALKNKDVKSIEDQKRIVDELLPIFKKIDNTIEQTHWIQKLAEVLSIREDDVRQEMKKVKLPDQEFEIQKEKKGKPRRELLEETILSIILINPLMVEKLNQEQKELFTFIEDKKDDSYIIMKSELLKEEEIDIDDEWHKCVYEIENIYREEKRKKIIVEIKEKEKEGSFEEVKKLLLEFNKLTKKDDKK